MADWQREIELRLVKSRLYSTLKSKAEEKSQAIASQQLSLIYECIAYAYQKSKLVIKYMPEYTLHDGEHLFRVLYLMEKIIPSENIKKLSIPELTLLILTAFFHDIGMAASEEELRAWQRDWEGKNPTEKEKALFEEYNRFTKTYPDKLEEIERLELSGQNVKALLLKSHLISERIRSTHAERARSIISKDWEGKILYNEQDLSFSFAELCFSHNEDAMVLLGMEADFLCDEETTVNLPFIGVVLRLADLLDFDGKRTPSVLFSHLAVRNPISLLEWEKHRSIKAWSIEPNRISFSASCKHPAIEASIRKFCDIIDDELRNCSVIISKLHADDRYNLELPTHVDRSKIHAEKDISTGKPKYQYQDTSFNLNKNQIIELLMGTKLYGNPEVALRELLQNSIDACLLSRALHKKWNVPYEPLVKVKYYTENDEEYLEIIDNGIGMNQSIIDKYYSNIGSSYYKSREFFELQANTNIEFDPISQFGIGILSCFMVADSMEVETKKLKDQYDYDSPVKIIIEGYDSIFTTIKSNKKTPGTSTKLFLRKKKNPWEKLSNDEFVLAVKKAVAKPAIPIEITTDKEMISYTKKEFYSILAEELKDFTWRADENIKEIKFSFNDFGFEGNANVAILEKNDVPVSKVEKLSKTIEIDEVSYELNMEIGYKTNEIKKKSLTIDIDDDGKIKSSLQESFLARSISKFSNHGITYYGGLFPNYYTRDKKAMLRWPFPFLLVLDIEGKNDLDLNSARDEIIYNEKWNKFEQILAYIICRGIRDGVDEVYWSNFIKIITKNQISDNFRLGLERLVNG